MDIIAYILSKKFAKKYTDSQIAAISKGMTYRGSVNNKGDLPLDNNAKGDVFTVTNEQGQEYVWTSDLSSGTIEIWELLGGVDLSNFYNKDETNELLNLKQDVIGYTPANDTAVVHNTEDENISGNKIFTGQTNFNNYTFMNADTKVTGNLFVVGDERVNNLFINNNGKINFPANSFGTVSIQKTADGGLGFYYGSQLPLYMDASGYTFINKDAKITGNFTITGDAAVQRNLFVSGDESVNTLISNTIKSSIYHPKDGAEYISIGVNDDIILSMHPTYGVTIKNISNSLGTNIPPIQFSWKEDGLAKYLDVRKILTEHQTLKTINGKDIRGDGNVDVRTYQPVPET